MVYVRLLGRLTASEVFDLKRGAKDAKTSLLRLSMWHIITVNDDVGDCPGARISAS